MMEVLSLRKEPLKEGMVWGFGINRCKLVYLGWINDKILEQHGELCSMSCDKPQHKEIGKTSIAQSNSTDLFETGNLVRL